MSLGIYTVPLQQHEGTAWVPKPVKLLTVCNELWREVLV